MNQINLAIIEDDLVVQESLVEFFGLQANIETVLVSNSVSLFFVVMPPSYSGY